MAANTAPIYVLKAKVGQASLSTANTALDGTGTVADVITGDTDGTRIDKIVVQAIGTTQDGMVRLFLFDGVSTTTLIAEVKVDAVTPSATVKAFGQTLDLLPNGLMIPNGYILRASTHQANNFVVTAFAGIYS